jgi:SAM-dependent methyltransferase
MALEAIRAFVRQANPGAHEVEFRIKDHTMSQGVDFETFERVKNVVSGNRLWKAGKEESSTVVFYQHKTSRHQYRTVNGVPEFKKRVFVPQPLKKQLDEVEQTYGIRCAQSVEEPIHIRRPTEYRETMRRHRIRRSFSYDSLRLDFTKVTQTNGVFFEIECEYLAPGSVDVVPILLDIVKHVQGGVKVYTIPELQRAASSFHALLKTPRFPAPLPRTLTDPDMVSCAYSVTEKADGTRFLAYADPKGFVFFIGRPKGKQTKCIYMGRTKVKNMVIDGELVGNDFYAFDALYYKGDIRHHHLKDRLTVLGKVVMRLNKYDTMRTLFHVKTFYLSHNGGTVRMKILGGMSSQFIPKKDIFQTALEIYKKKHPYELDGIIFTPMHMGYANERIFKWKEQNTIDFFYSNGTLHVAGNKGDEYLNLPFSGLDGKGTFEVFKGGKRIHVKNDIFTSSLPDEVRFGKVSTSLFKGYEDQVVECYFENGRFVPLKSRVDKVIANNVMVVNDAWKSVVFPITLEDMKNQRYTCIRRFHNRIKKHLIDAHVDKEILDIGSGAGGDIQKYIDAKAKRVVGFDIVPVKYPHPNYMTFIHMNKASYDVKNVLTNKGMPAMFDVVYVHFAAHYFFRDIRLLHQFMINVSKNLRKGGKCIMTMMDGAMIHTLFEKYGLSKGSTLQLNKDDAPLCTIKRNYDTFQLVGNTIEVMLHGTKYFEAPSVEYAVDTKAFAHHMKEYGMHLNSRKGFRSFKSFDEHDVLHPAERTFSYLNCVLEFTRS